MPAAMDTEVFLQEEIGKEHCNELSCSKEHSCTETTDDPTLLLECTSEESTADIMVFRSGNLKSLEQKRSSKKSERPVNRNWVVSGHYCKFCGKLQSVICLHLVNAHRDQPQISRIVQLPLQSKERRKHLKRLVAEGDQKYNEQMLQTGMGTVISSQSPMHCSSVPGNLGQTLQKKNLSLKRSLSYKASFSQKLNRTSDCNKNWKKSSYNKLQKSSFNRARSLSKYLRCERCGSFVIRSAAWLHHRRCAWARLKTKLGEQSSNVSSTSQNAGRDCCIQSISYDNILNNKDVDSNVDDMLSLILDDSLQSVLTKDILVRQYASLRMQALRNQDIDSADSIYSLCQELQALAMLVVECQRRKPSADLFTLIHPDHFNLVILVLRRQLATIVNILSHVINIKIVNTLQHHDNVAARHAWNFRELYLLWQDSLREDDAVLHTDADVQEEMYSSAEDGCQSLSQTSRQPENVECMSDAQPKSCYSHDNTCLTEANVLSDTFKDNPLQHVYPNSSFATLALDGDVIDQMRSMLPHNSSRMLDVRPEVLDEDGIVASDGSDSGHLLDTVANDHQQAGTSINAEHMDSKSRNSSISSLKTIIIRGPHARPYCYFCGKCPANLHYHWRSMHANRKEVIKLTSSETMTARYHCFKKLQNLGNHRHNQKVLRDRRGIFVVYCYKPGAKPEDYSPCAGCLHYVMKTELLQHRCRLLPTKPGRQNKRTISNNVASISAMSSDDIYSQKYSKPPGVDEANHIGIQSVSNPVMSEASRGAPCYFCGKWNTKMFRHLKAKHRDEPEMMDIMSMGSSDNAAYSGHIRRIRNLGTHQHNVKVLKKGHGNFIVARISETSTESPHDYLPCEVCWSYVKKAHYSRHHCKLRAQSDQADHTGNRDRQHFADAHFLLPTANKFYDQVSEILDGLRNGDMKLVAQSDPLIREYVAKLLSIRVAADAITRKLQLLVQFLIEIRKLTGLYNATLCNCILPDKFQQCVLAVKMLGRFDSETSSYQDPPSVLKIRNILRQLSKLLKRNAMDKRDVDAVKAVDQFAQWCMSEWKFPSKSSQENSSDVEPESE